MLLKHLYDYAHSRNLLADVAFTPKAVRWVIDLGADGNLLGQGPTNTNPNERRGEEFPCPWTLLMGNSGKISNFLTGGIDSVFGLSPNPNKPKDEAKLAAKHEHFWSQIIECAKAVPCVSAVVKFKNQMGAPPSFLQIDGTGWQVCSAQGSCVKLKDELFTFRVDGVLLIEHEPVKQWWREQFRSEVNATKKSAQRGVCIVTGERDQALADTHSVKIMGLPDGQQSGAALVSFDKPAFSSYGFSKSLNCPTSVDSALAYTIALNDLIKSDDTSLRLGGTVLCFWAKDSKTFGSWIAGLLNKPDPLAVSEFMKSPWAGMNRELAKKDLFIATTFKGCGGRVAVNHWVQEPLDQAVENFQKWFADLEIDTPPHQTVQATRPDTDTNREHRPLSIYWLASTIPPLKRDKGRIKADMDKLRPEVPVQLYRAALEGHAPSTLLIVSILNQLKSRLVGDDGYKPGYDQSRFALLKLILNRNRKESDMEIRPHLTVDTDDPAYNCGRLLSVLAEAQNKAHDYKLTGPGVVERYFGTASVSPASVFPLLLRLNRHHLSKISKSPKWKGHDKYLESLINSILAKFRPDGAKLPPQFPRTLSLLEQGRFALGFYQQQAEDERSLIANRVLKYLEDTEPARHVAVLAVRESDRQSFYEQIDSHYGSTSFKEWMGRKRQASATSESDEDDLLDNA
jgi:CRISPR-associated protein Csd1